MKIVRVKNQTEKQGLANDGKHMVQGASFSKLMMKTNFNNRVEAILPNNCSRITLTTLVVEVKSYRNRCANSLCHATLFIHPNNTQIKYQFIHAVPAKTEPMGDVVESQWVFCCSRLEYSQNSLNQKGREVGKLYWNLLPTEFLGT